MTVRVRVRVRVRARVRVRVTVTVTVRVRVSDRAHAEDGGQSAPRVAGDGLARWGEAGAHLGIRLGLGLAYPLRP